MVRETVRPDPLLYASNRAQITREGDGFVAVFPPAESAFDFWVHVTALFGVSVFCLVCTFLPAGETRIGGASVIGPDGVLARIVSFAIGIGSAVGLRYVVRNRGARATLELRGTKLVDRGVEYDLARYVDVDVIEASDRESVYLLLRPRGGAAATGGPPEAELARRPSTSGEEVDLEMVADALRRAAWPERAAQRRRRSTFTRTGPDAIESDKWFAVRLPGQGRVEYGQDGKTMSLNVERGWSADHAMCFVIGRDDLSRWDGDPADVTLPAETQREILHNLGEALREWGVRVLVKDPR